MATVRAEECEKSLFMMSLQVRIESVRVARVNDSDAAFFEKVAMLARVLARNRVTHITRRAHSIDASSRDFYEHSVRIACAK
jgi:hypothetical protein